MDRRSFGEFESRRLRQMLDVSSARPADGQRLAWSDAFGKWVPTDGSSATENSVDTSYTTSIISFTDTTEAVVHSHTVTEDGTYLIMAQQQVSRSSGSFQRFFVNIYINDVDQGEEYYVHPQDDLSVNEILHWVFALSVDDEIEVRFQLQFGDPDSLVGRRKLSVIRLT